MRPRGRRKSGGERRRDRRASDMARGAGRASGRGGDGGERRQMSKEKASRQEQATGAATRPVPGEPGKASDGLRAAPHARSLSCLERDREIVQPSSRPALIDRPHCKHAALSLYPPHAPFHSLLPSGNPPMSRGAGGIEDELAAVDLGSSAPGGRSSSTNGQPHCQSPLSTFSSARSGSAPGSVHS
jgi:hypothetical protein